MVKTFRSAGSVAEFTGIRKKAELAAVEHVTRMVSQDAALVGRQIVWYADDGSGFAVRVHPVSKSVKVVRRMNAR